MTKRKVSRQNVRRSTKRQREEERKRRQAQQNRIITAAAGVLIIIVVGVVFRQLLTRNVSETEAETERPLGDLDPTARNGYYDQYPEMVIDTAKEYEAVLRTEKGDLLLRLFDDEAPLAVNNFVFLTRQGFYDGTTFHRVIDGFMAQGGDPSGVGTGGPGYQFEDETDNGLTFDRPGLLAMANSGRDTNGSQFFITFVPTPHLDGAHTIFGELIEGEAVLNSLSRIQADPTASTPQGDVIERVDIIEG